MPWRTPLTARLGIAHPIVQAPLGGANATPPALVVAASEAGALGFIGAAYMTPDEIAAAASAVRSGTTRPFGINLFAPTPDPEVPRDPQPALDLVARRHTELGIAAPSLP